MIKAVLDSNTLVSAIIVPHGIPRQILRSAYEQRFACISSAPIVTEVIRTLGLLRVRRKYEIRSADIERLRRFLESDLVSVGLNAQVHGVATHSEDDLILSTAVSAKADYLVTGDRQLLKLGSYHGVRVLSPRDFLTILGD